MKVWFQYEIEIVFPWNTKNVTSCVLRQHHLQTHSSRIHASHLQARYRMQHYNGHKKKKEKKKKNNPTNSINKSSRARERSYDMNLQFPGFPEERNARLNRHTKEPLTPLPNNHLPILIEQFSTKGESPRWGEEESRPAWQCFRVFRARVGPGALVRERAPFVERAHRTRFPRQCSSTWLSYIRSFFSFSSFFFSYGPTKVAPLNGPRHIASAVSCVDGEIRMGIKAGRTRHPHATECPRLAGGEPRRRPREGKSPRKNK